LEAGDMPNGTLERLGLDWIFIIGKENLRVLEVYQAIDGFGVL